MTLSYCLIEIQPLLNFATSAFAMDMCATKRRTQRSQVSLQIAQNWQVHALQKLQPPADQPEIKYIERYCRLQEAVCILLWLFSSQVSKEAHYYAR
ncbi:hypothetical protein GDO81_003516 [Engystomops pustulosus]|uniref:Uncharacterized protein n=1 Tax=Engystomops pustulosus TaxID=76066 RepID=A0AAV6ZX54_ENGPU|nr:hypothetical protein GDO81_003516 [Engystomops pustulosus]